jgi:transcriptional regulator with GAF, ATPase, and Fis domain
MSTSKTRNNEQQSVTNPERLLIGDSQSMKEVEQDIHLSAKAEISVLITGESGVGKELVAQEIHHRSGRAWGPFKTINCGSLTESLLESRLFGHVKGSFTGAAGNQSGLFEAANGGTIFLDEIGDMPMHLQVYLLRVLQERTILPVGSNTERKVDVRVIAATNKDLEREAREGRFRQDLYYRLNQFHIRVPALREHSCDIPILIRHFLDPLEIEEGALALLCHHPWPGNVRELKATVDRLALRAVDGGVITTGQVWREIGPREKITAEGAAADGHSGKRRDVITYAGELHKGDSVDEHFDRQKLVVYKELVKSAGSYSNAAKWLGMKPQALHNRIRRLKR